MLQKEAMVIFWLVQAFIEQSWVKFLHLVNCDVYCIFYYLAELFITL